MIRPLFLSTVFLSLLLTGCQHPMNLQSPEDPNKTSYQFVRHTPDLAGGSEKKHRIPQPLSLDDLRQKYQSNFILKGSPEKREIALTFDDAPDAHFTPKILDALKKENVKATFFVVGNRVEKHPDIMRRILREGHAVGNHSYNHANFNHLSDDQFRDQIIRTDQILEKFMGYRPNIVRPPYGNVTENQIQWLISQRKKIINWNVDSLDWKGLNADQVSTNVLSAIQPGSIVLQHAGGGEGEDLTGTVEAIPEIVKKLRADGVKFVTIPELLELNPS